MNIRNFAAAAALALALPLAIYPAVSMADDGAKWERISGGLPTHEITAIVFDEPTGRLFLTAASTNMLWQSSDQGANWERAGDTGYRLHNAALMNGRIVGATGFNGLVVSPPNAVSAASLGGSAQ